MENHPIPQDVTGFKFKLIGSVTVKQFLYIIGGGIAAAVFFMLPISPFIKYPLCAFFGGIGAMLAFVPIEGRPMDVMMKNFFKALPAENQYIFRKKGADVLIGEFFSLQTITSIHVEEKKVDDKDLLEKKRALLFGALKKSYRPDERETAILSNINSYLADSTQHTTSPSIQNVDKIPEMTPLIQIVTPPTPTQVDPPESINETPTPKPSPPIQLVEQPPSPITPSQPKELITPRVAQEPQTPIPMPVAPITTILPKASIQEGVSASQTGASSTIATTEAPKAGFPQLPDIPNVILGIIKDPRGKILPNILVEIMDLQNIPVRAFKTNALGQFAAATPLPDGEYNVLLEDSKKQHEFEKMHIILDGKIFEPLEIVSIDLREKLRRELFGGTQGAQAV